MATKRTTLRLKVNIYHLAAKSHLVLGWNLHFPFSCLVCSLTGGSIGLWVVEESRGASVVLTTLGKLGCLLRATEWDVGEMSGEALMRLGKGCK